MQVVFFGMGKMGLPMARHLLAAGHRVSVTDVSPDRLKLAEAAGLAVTHNVGADMATADVVLSSLPHDAALLSVGQQVAAQLRAGAFLVDTSTVSVATSAQVAALFANPRAYVRVSVSGNNHMAEAAQLTVMASGERASYDAVLPLLSSWGSSQFYLGLGEQARLMKLVINLMIAQTSAMLAEALTLGSKGGLEWQTLWQVIAASAVASPIVKAKAVQLSQRDFTPTFTVPQMLKDIDLILAEGAALNVPLLQTAMTRQMMQAALAQGLGEQDYAAVIQVVEQSAAAPFVSKT